METTISKETRRFALFRRPVVRWLAWGAVGMVVMFVLAMGVICLFGLCDHLVESDVGLVLGNALGADGQPAADLRSRLDAALVLRRQGYFEWVIVSGGIEPDGRDEALVMRDYLVARGVPAGFILVDSAGVNTYESARHTVAAMRAHGWDDVCVVTQYFHVPRARLALARFGARGVWSGSARCFEARDVYSTAREVVGYAWYFVRHYDRLPGGPHPHRDAGS